MTFIIRLYVLVIMKSERISDGSELSLRISVLSLMAQILTEKP